MSSSGHPSHIEIGVPDTDRARKFYGELLGWSYDATPNGASADTGGIPAGIHADSQGPDVIVFFAVDDIEAAARRIVELGGEVDEAGEDGETGRYLYACRDDQGVTFGLHQPAT
jgi:uncharacterized protein